MKLSTTIDSLPLGVDCPLTSSYVLLGSCFVTSIGELAFYKCLGFVLS